MNFERFRNLARWLNLKKISREVFVFQWEAEQKAQRVFHKDDCGIRHFAGVCSG